ncbi:hypothetical protein N9L68_03045 [bacterium]|nr:hypothetical protein [bacterium]
MTPYDDVDEDGDDEDDGAAYRISVTHDGDEVDVPYHISMSRYVDDHDVW